jgi:molybdate transport system substrate-binding protein
MLGLRRTPVMFAFAVVAFTVALARPDMARAEPLKVLTAGAFKQVLLAILPQFETADRKVQWDNDTVGALLNRIEAGESFDVVIASPAALERLAKSGRIAAGTIELAKVGVGVAVREGAARPEIATVEGFKQTLLAAKAVAYIDPASGGSSGIYLSGLLDRLGIGDAIRPKSVLVQGGAAADRVASGEADVAVQQISELLPVKGVAVVGPLPSEIQNYTVYAAGIAAGTRQAASANALIDLLRSRGGAAVLRSRGMEPIDQDPPAK